jgi:catechol 2,3-dioxygenase-like lactoylglutathione lyase family enzyme
MAAEKPSKEGTPVLSIVVEDQDRPGLELDLDALVGAPGWPWPTSCWRQLRRAGATFVDGVKVEREDQRKRRVIIAGQGGTRMETVSVRYIVDDVDAAIAFYTKHLGFTVDMHPAPGFAALSRGELRLLLNATGGAGGASQPMPDGRQPEPGGWNRIQVSVDDLEGRVEILRKAGARFRNDIVTGLGGKQILLDDPAGNPIELFEAAR